MYKYLQMLGGLPYKKQKEIVAEKISDPKYFGPRFWAVLEILALSNEKACREFITLLDCAIPCPECQDSYRIHCKGIEEDDMFAFVVELHNRVNGNEYSPEERLLEIEKSLTFDKLN